MGVREHKLSESKHRLLRMGPLTEEAGTGAYCVIHRLVIPSNTNSLFIKVNVDSLIRRFIDFLQCLKVTVQVIREGKKLSAAPFGFGRELLTLPEY